MPKTQRTSPLPKPRRPERVSAGTPDSLILESLLNALPDLMLRIGMDGVIHEVLNPGHPDLLGEADTLEGTRLVDLMDDEPIRQWQDAVQAVQRNGGGATYEYALRFPEGLRHFEARIARCGKDEVLSAVRNITQRVHAEQQLMQSAKLASIGEMATAMVLELNTPLATIQLCGQVIQRLLTDTSQSAATAEQIQRIFRQVERASQIIEQLRVLAHKSDEGEWKRFSLQQVIENVLTLFEERLQIEGTRLLRQLPKRPLWVHGNPAQIEQVVQSLLSNARDALRDTAQRELLLKGGHRQGWMFLEVRDSGTGVAPEHRSRIFDPFFSTKPNNKGIGLGLTISHGIVTTHGGRLRYTPHRKGGSVFRMELPGSPAAGGT